MKGFASGCAVLLLGFVFLPLLVMPLQLPAIPQMLITVLGLPIVAIVAGVIVQRAANRRRWQGPAASWVVDLPCPDCRATGFAPALTQSTPVAWRNVCRTCKGTKRYTGWIYT